MLLSWLEGAQRGQLYKDMKDSECFLPPSPASTAEKSLVEGLCTPVADHWQLPTVDSKVYAP